MSHREVVKVFATTQDPDFDSPWQSRPPSNGTGSGVVVGPNEILTGAHVVANATFIQVQKISQPDKAIAQVKAICHDADLALLEVLDHRFLEDVEPVEIGDLPDLRDKVSVVGFPVGGEEISITEGVVSRVEMQRYTHSQRSLLAVTVDAAINEGNSGGPVFLGGKVVGIAFQVLSNAENIGEIVPAPILRHFLEGVRRKKQNNVPGLGLRTQNLENRRLRDQVGLKDGQSGVLVARVDYQGSCWEMIQPRDVLLEIDGHAIANNGTIRYRNRFRTRYDVVLSDHYVGDTLDLTVWRKGERRRVQVVLKPLEFLVPRFSHDKLPTFFVYGGLVFQTLTRDFLATWDEWWNKAPKEFLSHYYMGERGPERKDVVVLTQILADEVNLGYSHLYNEGIVAVNGHMPRDMTDFVNAVESSKDVLEIETSSQGIIVFDPSEVREATPRILKRYHIPRDRSGDLPGPPAPVISRDR
jgi:S1-C subfamily serine protease